MTSILFFLPILNFVGCAAPFGLALVLAMEYSR